MPSEDTLPGGWDAAAAEYVLGLLHGEGLRAFEAKLARDKDLQQDVVAWTEYFASLSDVAPAQNPPPQIFRRIEAALFSEPRKTLWQAVLPYVVGAVVGATVAWAVFSSGLLLSGG